MISIISTWKIMCVGRIIIDVMIHQCSWTVDFKNFKSENFTYARCFGKPMSWRMSTVDLVSSLLIVLECLRRGGGGLSIVLNKLGSHDFAQFLMKFSYVKSIFIFLMTPTEQNTTKIIKCHKVSKSNNLWYCYEISRGRNNNIKTNQEK